MQVILDVVGLAGVLLKLLGSLYLAYDLLGGPNGSLRVLTEVITYVLASLFVSIGSYLVLFYIVTLFNFRIVAILGNEVALAGMIGLGVGGGLGTGLAYSLSLRVPRSYSPFDLPYTYAQSIARACLIGAITGLFGLGIYFIVAVTQHILHTPATAFTFGLLYNLINGAVLGSLVARLLVHRIIDSQISQRPTFDWLGLHTGVTAGLIIGVLVGFGYWIFFGPDPTIALGGLMGGILGGVGLGIVIGSAAQARWWIDHLPLRHMGSFGVALIVTGLSTDAIPYLVNLLSSRH